MQRLIGYRLSPRFYLLHLLIMGGFLGLIACQPNLTESSQSMRSENTPQTLAENEIQLLSQDFITAKAERYQPSLTVTGTLEVVNKHIVQATTGSQVTNVLVKVGEKVKKGDKLIVLNLEDSQNQLAKAQADLLASEAQAKISMSLAEKNRQLLEKGFVAKIEYEKSVAEANANQEMVKAKQAQVNIAKKMFGDMTLFAPMSGMVAHRNVEVGQVVNAGQPLIEIIDPNQLEFSADVVGEAQSQIQIGQTVPFTINDLNITFMGVISRIAPAVDPNSRQLKIYITIPPSPENSNLKAGMFAKGNLPYGQMQVGVLVPSSAIILDNQDTKNSDTGFVWVMKSDQTLTKQAVTLIKHDENNRQYLISGIEANTVVILTPLNDNDQGKKVVIKS